MAETRDGLDRDDMRGTILSANPDALTGAPGSHPIGTGVGAAAAGAAGAAIGSVIPGAGSVVGGAVGAVVGAVAGGLAGKGVAEAIDPTAEDAYWRANYQDRPYVATGVEYEEYAPAYRHGWEAGGRYAGREFEEVEPDLGKDWERVKSPSRLNWDKARDAAKDAWERVTHGRRGR
jgi:hypothetical protein